MKYRTWVLGVGERRWATSGQTFDTLDEAKDHMSSLYSRWFGMDKGAVLPANVADGGYINTQVVEQNAVWTIG